MTGSPLGLMSAAWALALAATWLAREIARRLTVVDEPNARSAHVRPTPRVGGIGILLGFLAPALVAAPSASAAALIVIGATLAIGFIGLVDDLRSLPVFVRLGAQICAAAVVVGAGGHRVAEAWTLVPMPTWSLVPASVLWIVWLTNVNNFMDGIDGLAGGQAVIAGTAIARTRDGRGRGRFPRAELPARIDLHG